MKGIPHSRALSEKMTVAQSATNIPAIYGIRGTITPPVTHRDWSRSRAN
jgi:hypothetical protein